MIKKLILYLSMMTCSLTTQGQSNITFRHLNTSHGLSYLGVVDMCTDLEGNLWIGTGNGLNMFNGKTVERYFATEYPQLQNSYITHVACDRKNRIWVLTANGNMTIIDEKRKFHRLGLYDQGQFVKTRWVIGPKYGNLLLFTSKGHYALPDAASLAEMDSLTLDQFTPFDINDFDSLQTKFYKQVFRYDDQHYLFVQEDVFYKVNYQTHAVEQKYAVPHCTALTSIGENGLMYYDRESKEVKIIDLVSGTTTMPFQGMKDQFGRPVKGTFVFAEKINPARIILTTSESGIYVYEPSQQKIYNHTHYFADNTSISANMTSTIEVSPSGWIFIDCNPTGVSYYNSNEIVSNQYVFTDQAGKGYDGFIAGIATKDNNTYYIGTAEGILVWTRNTNTTRFLHFTDSQNNPLPAPQEIVSIVIDSYDKVWATTITQGIIVIDKNNKLVRHITHEGPEKYRLKQERANRLVIGPDGYVWVTGKNGLCKINPVSFEVDHFNDSFLSVFDTLNCPLILFTDKDNLWLSVSSGGVAHCNLTTQTITRYNKENGLINNGIFDLGVDRNKNIYVATRQGLSILMTNGRIKNFTQKEGLLINRAEGLLLDKHNRMWIGNDIGLACYTPQDSSLTTFDTRHGLSIYGFRVGSYFQMPNGEFFFGTPHGLQYFFPDSLFDKKIALHASINRIETKDVYAYLNEDATFHLSSSDKHVTFYFNAVEFSPQIRTYYEYRLSGLSNDWVTLVDQNWVRYNSLPPGKYVFSLRISSDNKNWQDAENQVTIFIAAPFYMTWWFYLSVLFLLGLVAWLLIRRYRFRQQDQREQLETEIVIHYFASQINRHKNEEEMLWDVAKNCISKLNLEECVIYMLDAKRDVLVQKAVYGPKNPMDQTILLPIDIPVGRGITGTVAQTQVAEIIGNTERDPRYIVDDVRRYSEITVPIIMDGQTIGVIDSEHSQKHFFTQKHLNLLNTIAVLSANQIQRIRAEDEKQKAQIEVLQNKQKATESRLQSLRLQMNPHFLFNALNSIQQMILANEEMVATRYLSRFSKLLRSILIHSDKESISLKEELDILKLYVELESVRFKDSFTYTIDCDEDIDVDELKIPTLLIQPFVENAIWHGLMHKEGQRHLSITFTDMEDHVQCVIEDNGIGRQKAREMKITSGQDKKHTSKGIEVSMERLHAMNKNGGATGSLEIIDMVDAQGTALGTRVEINLPIQN